MPLVRFIARPLLAGIFLAGGLDVMKNPEPRARLAAPVVARVNRSLPLAPEDPVDAVRLNAAVHMVGAGMLLLNVLPRVAALALAGSLVPTTFGGHRFWEQEDPMQSAMQRTHFLKNAAILGGLLVFALD